MKKDINVGDVPTEPALSEGTVPETGTAFGASTIAIAPPHGPVFTHKDIWKCSTPYFTVEVSRHTEAPLSEHVNQREGVNRWAVYAYIYPAHPHFVKFNGDGLFQPACNELPGHSYVSYLKYHRDGDGHITSVQVGWDYHHDGDWIYTHDATREDASTQFRDAEQLFAFLAQATKQ